MQYGGIPHLAQALPVDMQPDTNMICMERPMHGKTPHVWSFCLLCLPTLVPAAVCSVSIATHAARPQVWLLSWHSSATATGHCITSLHTRCEIQGYMAATCNSSMCCGCAAGPPDTDAVPPSERPGTLWELYRQLDSEGWSLDAFSYTTNFRSVCKSSTNYLCTCSTLHEPCRLFRLVFVLRSFVFSRFAFSMFDSVEKWFCREMSL